MWKSINFNKFYRKIIFLVVSWVIVEYLFTQTLEKLNNIIQFSYLFLFLCFFTLIKCLVKIFTLLITLLDSGNVFELQNFPFTIRSVTSQIFWALYSKFDNHRFSTYLLHSLLAANNDIRWAAFLMRYPVS